jgi:hypothetical protein
VSENEDSPRSAGSAGPAVETILAGELHVTDVLRRDGLLHRVTSLRVQGAPPEVCIELAGLAARLHYPPTARVSVLRRRR